MPLVSGNAAPTRGGGYLGQSATLCDMPSGCCFLMGPWTVTRSLLRPLRRVAAFCRPVRPVLPLVSFPRPSPPCLSCAKIPNSYCNLDNAVDAQEEKIAWCAGAGKENTTHNYPNNQSFVGSSGHPTLTTNVPMALCHWQICHQTHVLCGHTTFIPNQGPYAYCSLGRSVCPARTLRATFMMTFPD